MASSTEATDDGHFPFMKLPPEIRCMIYKEVFSTPVLQVDFAPSSFKDNDSRLFLTRKKMSETSYFFRRIYCEERAVLVTCKTVRTEALPCYNDSLQYSVVHSTHADTNAVCLQDAWELLRPVQIVCYPSFLYASLELESLPSLREVRIRALCGMHSRSMAITAKSRKELEEETCTEARYFFNEFARRRSTYQPLLRQLDKLDGRKDILIETSRQLPYKISVCLEDLYVKAWQRSWDYVIVDLEAKRIVRSSPTDDF